MNKYRITKQIGIFPNDQEVNDKNRVHTFEIDADEYQKVFDEILITNDNLEYAKKYLNIDYKIGDKHISPIKSVLFKINNEEIENINILADPYYKLDILVNGNWVEIDKHNYIKNIKK